MPSGNSLQESGQQDYSDHLLHAAFHFGWRAAILNPGKTSNEIVDQVASREITTVFPASEVSDSNAQSINELVVTERLIATRIARFLAKYDPKS